jgi:hypothetical protein
MFSNRKPRPLSVETSIPYNGKWRIVNVRGEYVRPEEPELQFVMLLAKEREIKAELSDEQRAIIMKELIVAAKRDSGGVSRRWVR